MKFDATNMKTKTAFFRKFGKKILFFSFLDNLPHQPKIWSDLAKHHKKNLFLAKKRFFVGLKEKN